MAVAFNSSDNDTSVVGGTTVELSGAMTGAGSAALIAICMSDEFAAPPTVTAYPSQLVEVFHGLLSPGTNHRWWIGYGIDLADSINAFTISDSTNNVIAGRADYYTGVEQIVVELGSLVSSAEDCDAPSVTPISANDWLATVHVGYKSTNGGIGFDAPTGMTLRGGFAGDFNSPGPMAMADTNGVLGSTAATGVKTAEQSFGGTDVGPRLGVSYILSPQALSNPLGWAVGSIPIVG